MAAIKSTGLTLAGARSEFFEAYDAADVFPWEQFALAYQSDKDAEHHRWLGSVPMMREWGTGRLAKGLRSESYDVANLKYEATIKIDRDEESDDQTGQIKLRIQELADAAKDNPAYLMAQLLINGATAGYVSYDGLTFFNTAHVSGASGNQNNALTFTAAAATKTTAECKGALTASIAALLAYKDDQGRPMNQNTTGIAIVVPPAMVFPMMEAASASVIATTDNVLKQLGLQVLSFPWLTLGTTFYTCKIGARRKPFIFQDREPLEFHLTDYTDENGFMTEKRYAGARARYALTYGMWQHCVRTVFSN